MQKSIKLCMARVCSHNVNGIIDLHTFRIFGECIAKFIENVAKWIEYLEYLECLEYFEYPIELCRFF